jgi:hypothetical protein
MWWTAVSAAMAVAVASAAPAAHAADISLLQSPGYKQPRDVDEWQQREERGGLEPYPAATRGTRNPAGGLSQFGAPSSVMNSAS